MLGTTVQWLNLSIYRPLVLPVGLLLAAITNYDIPNLALATHFLTPVVPFELMLFTIVLAGILVLLSLFRDKLSPGWARGKGFDLHYDTEG